MSDEGSDSWDVVEESSSDEEEPEYADARLLVDVEAFLASAAALSQSSAGRADLVQAAVDTVERVARAEASSARDKLRRYKTVKNLIRHLKSFLFSTRRPSVFEKCFVESIQANTSAIESRGGDLVEALDMDLQCFPLVNGEIGCFLEKPSSQIPGQGTEPLGASFLHHGKDGALSQAASLSTTASPQTATTPAGVGDTCLLEPAWQKPASQEATLQKPAPQEATLQEPALQEASLLGNASEDGWPRELVHQEATSVGFPGQLETPAWNLSPWDSESIWTLDSSCDSSHSDADEPTCSSSSSSSSYQVLTDAAEEEAAEALSPTMVLWLARRQAETSEGEAPGVTLCAAQVLRVTAKWRPPDMQPPVQGEAVLAEVWPQPSGTEPTARAAEAAGGDAGAGGDREEPGQQDARGVPGDGIPEEAGDRQEEAAPWELAAFAQRCRAHCQRLLQQLSDRLALTPAQARHQLRLMWLTSLLLSLAILLMLGAFEVSRQALRYEGKSLQAYKEENRVLLAEIQAMNETIQELRRLHAVELEGCRAARAAPVGGPGTFGAWGAWQQGSDAGDKLGWWRVLDHIAAPLKKASSYMQEGVSRTLKDILRIHNDSIRKLFKTDQVDEPESSPDELYASGYELVYKLREFLQSVGYKLDSDAAFAHAVLQLYGEACEEEPGLDEAGQSVPEKPRETGQDKKAKDSQDRKAQDSQGKKAQDSQDRKAEDSQDRRAEDSQGRRAEDSQGLPDEGQRGARQVRFHAKTGPHRGGEPEKKEKGGKEWRQPSRKFIQKLKNLGRKACMEMKAKEVRSVIKRLERLMKKTDRFHMDCAQAEVDCQVQWWGAGDWPEMHFIPGSCEARVGAWQLELRNHKFICGQGKKACKKQRREEGRRHGKKHKSKYEPEDPHLFENVHCDGQFEEAHSAWVSQMGHQYQPSHNQADSQGNKLSRDHAGGSRQQKSPGGQEADAEGKWYEEMMEQREQQRKADGRDDWYILRGKARREERKAARESDWFFDRHQRRKWWRNYKNKFWNWMYSNTFGYFR